MKTQPASSPVPTARFKAPYDSHSPLARLRHFRSRKDVHFFPTPDAEQVRRERIDDVLRNRFTLNNETHDLPPGFDWHSNPSDDLEWQIMLHKFYFATGLGMAYQETGDEVYMLKWIELTESWIETVQPDLLAGRSIFNDQLYVAVEGRRIQSWISAYYHFVATNEHEPPPVDFHERLLASIDTQVDFLIDHLAPLRNHRTLELWAVFMAAVVFRELEAAARWQQLALDGLQQNVLDDLLPDGVQCELSTHYHHIVLRNYLSFRRLAKLNGIHVAPVVDEALLEALNFAIHVHKPDGDIPALSDADVFSYLDLIALGAELYERPDLAYVGSRGRQGRPPRERLVHFADSGYVTMRSGWGDREAIYEDERYLIFDCGPIGAGNHGHLDLLNIEVAAYGRSLIVDPGRYTYREPPEDSGEVNWRARFRETAAHNTVVIDGKNQARYVRAGKARRCKIKGPHPQFDIKLCQNHERLDVAQGVARSHEYDAIHERTIFFVDGSYWLIVDRLTAPTEHHYDLRFHLAADALGATHISKDDGVWSISSPGLVLANLGADDASIEASFVSQTYGEKREAPIVRFETSGANTLFATAVVPYVDNNDPPEITLIARSVNGMGSKPVDDAIAVELRTVLEGHQSRDLLCLSYGKRTDERRRLFATEGASWSAPYAALRRDEAGSWIALGHGHAGVA